MMSRLRIIARAVSTAAIALSFGAPVLAQVPLPLRLPDGRSVSFSSARLTELATDTLRVALHHGQEQTFRVVKLGALLLDAGVRIDSVRGPRTTWVVVAAAADGFRAAFTLAELAEDLGPSRVYLAVGTTTGPLPPDEGPFRLLVPTDRRQGRWARQVVSLEVVDALPRR
jgi:hypothetical protein